MLGRVLNLAPLAIGCVLLISGCADTANSINGFISKPFKKTPEQLLGIKTPDDRVKELRKMAKQAQKSPPAEQQRAVAELTHEFQHEGEGWVRRHILRALAAYPQPEAEAVLIKALSDGDVETRRLSCTLLGKRGGTVAVQELARVVSSETNKDVRMSAVEAMGESKDKGSMATLSEALVDPDPAMQALAVQSMTKISGRDFGNNVQAWREYAQTGKSEAAEISFAEKVRRSFY